MIIGELFDWRRRVHRWLIWALVVVVMIAVGVSFGLIVDHLLNGWFLLGAV